MIEADGDNRMSMVLRRRDAAKELERKLARIVLETGSDHPKEAKAKEKEPGDAAALRGVPLIGAMGGAIRYTRADAVIDLMDDRRRPLKDLLGSGCEGVPVLEPKKKVS